VYRQVILGTALDVVWCAAALSAFGFCDSKFTQRCFWAAALGLLVERAVLDSYHGQFGANPSARLADNPPVWILSRFELTNAIKPIRALHLLWNSEDLSPLQKVTTASGIAILPDTTLSTSGSFWNLLAGGLALLLFYKNHKGRHGVWHL